MAKQMQLPEHIVDLIGVRVAELAGMPKGHKDHYRIAFAAKAGAREAIARAHLAEPATTGCAVCGAPAVGVVRRRYQHDEEHLCVAHLPVRDLAPGMCGNA